VRHVAPLGVLLVLTAVAAQPATYTVGYQKTISVTVAGATAAYTVDPQIAEASADQGTVDVTGKSPGRTHLMVVTADGVQSLEILVPMPPPIYPRGWVTPRPEGLSNETGYLETRFSSLPEQLTSIVSFSRKGEDRSTQFYLSTTGTFPSSNSLLDPANFSKVAITGLSWSIQMNHRSGTFGDRLVDESPLTVSGALIRGLHWEEGNWFFHAGYTSPAPFEGLFLPLRAEGVFGTGYRYQLSAHSRLIPSFYFLTMPTATHSGNPGPILSLQYVYQPDDNLRFAAEIAEGRGAGASSSLTWKRRGENVRARVRYTPREFAALSVSNFRGIYSDLGWTRQWSERFGTDVNFTGDRFNLPSFNEVSVNGGIQLRYRPLRHWTVFGGSSYSLFHTEDAGQGRLEGVNYPEGVTFDSRHIGATFQHAWSRFATQNTGGQQYLSSAHFSLGHFSFGGYAERDTQAPTVGFLVSQVNGLAQLLSQYGLTATTPQQIGEFLNQNVALINLQYLSNVSVNVIPLREQVSGSASWQGHGSAPRIDYEYLRNIDKEFTSNNDSTIQRLTFTERLGLSNDISLTLAEYKTKATGQPTKVNPLINLSMKHLFNTAPGLLMLERHGTVKGRVFEDQEGQGQYSSSDAGVAGVELILDDGRQTRSGPDGSYRFSGVPEGKHEVRAVLHSEIAYYFTTSEQFDTSENSEVNFGIARSAASLGGEVLDDNLHGVAGIVVVVRRDNNRNMTVSGSDGKFLFPRLPDGEYSVSADGESLPPGYVIEEPAEVHAVAAPGKAPRVSLKVRAIRNISGRVVLYDRARGQYAGVRGVAVRLNEQSLTTTTDAEGRFLFREVRSGDFTIAADYLGQTTNQRVTVPEQPAQLTGINLIVGQR
jgi:SdrD B-like domain/Pilus formation protein N terminal region